MRFLVVVCLLTLGGALFGLSLTVWNLHQTEYRGEVDKSQYAEVLEYAESGCGELASFDYLEIEKARCPSCQPKKAGLCSYRLVVDNQCLPPTFSYNYSEASVPIIHILPLVFGTTILFLTFLSMVVWWT